MWCIISCWTCILKQDPLCLSRNFFQMAGMSRRYIMERKSVVFSQIIPEKKSTCDPEKRRATSESIKKQYNCPFKIRCNHIDLKANIKVPLSFLKVKVTWRNYNHTCQLSSIFYKTATQLLRGKAKLDLCGMNTLIMLLKTNFAIDASLCQ